MSRPLAAAALLAACAAAGSADPPPQAEAAPGVREAVYFGASGPVRVRFRVTLAGKPADAAWEDAVAGLFAFLDRNGDGALDAAERAPLSAPRRGRAADDPAADGTAPLRLAFGRDDEKVTRAAFAAALRAAGYGPVVLSAAGGRADAAELSAALFRHLDADRDGKLSPDEIRAARDRLAALDADEDEFLSAAELLGRSGPAAPLFARPAMAARAEEGPAPPDLLFLDPAGGPAVKQILAFRGGARAASLRPSEFGTAGSAFAALDKDGNGRLDTAELAAWLRKPPDADLALELIPGRLTILPAGPGAAFRATPDGAVVGTPPGARFRFEAPAGTGPRAAWEAAAVQLRQQFAALAKEKGPVTRKQLEGRPAALALFDFADRSAAGRVDAARVDAALRALAPLAACRAEIRFVASGSGLFGLLDRDGDGRLSPRELVEAPAALKPFADASGRVGPRDLPSRFHVTASAAGIPAVVAPPPAPVMSRGASPRVAPPGPVPEWFRKMDRNGDGDVSLREFLGPLELFRKLDGDGDGLISPEEARARSR